MSDGFRIEEVIRPEVRALTAYHVDRATYPVKLDANENPFEPSPTLEAAIGEALRGLSIHRYPDPEAQALRDLLARRLGVPAEQLLLGNGSDELIQMLLMAVAGPGAAVMAPVPTFSMYELGARAQGLPFVGVPLDARFAMDALAWRAALERERPRAVFIPSPNNPTGNCLDEAVIRETLDRCRGLVVVDEAYFDYCGRTVLPELPGRPNLVVLRTLSKIGMAGLRLGILAASPAVVGELNKVRLPYNINMLTQTVARLALEHDAEVRAHVKAILRERDALQRALRAFPEIEAFPSEANFLLLRTPFPADAIHGALARHGVSVRRFAGDPALARCLRVTVGLPEENARFLDALKRALGDARAAGPRA
ncbi:MAG TPA: histidinol-phosphate transaminase [Candidatus Methylomirabilis sp.]